MRGFLLAAALVFTWKPASAFISVMEGLATTKDAVFVGTTTPQLILNATSYNGSVPTVSLYASSNVVVGNCAIYSTGSITCLGVNLSTAGAGPFVRRTGDTMTGSLSISATGDSIYDLFLSTSLTFTQSAGNGLGIRWGDGSISTTASSGAGATGPPGGASTITVQGVVDNFLASVTGSQTAFTLSQTPASTAVVHLVQDGLTLYNPTDYSLSGKNLTMVIAPAANTSSFYAFYDIYTSTLPGVNMTIGITSSCAAGYYVSTATYTNGVLTGGGCVLAGTGSGGSSGHTISTGTLTSGSTGYPSRSVLTFDTNYFIAIDSPTLNTTFMTLSSSVVNNVIYSSAPIPNTTTSATSGATCISGSTLTWTSQGNLSKFSFQGTGGNTSAGAAAILYVLLDGVIVSPQSLPAAESAARIIDGSASQAVNLSFSFDVVPSSGARKACLALLSNGGVARIDGNNNISIFSVTEIIKPSLIIPTAGILASVNDNFLGQVNGSKTVFTLSQTPASAAAITLILDGTTLSGTSDYTYTSPTTITVTTAPISASRSFFAQYLVNTSTIPGSFILSSTQTVSGQTTFTAQVSVSSALVVLGSTFTVTSSGIVSIPSQPHALVNGAAQNVPTGEVYVQVFFVTSEEVAQGVWVSGSSATFTVPAGGAGGYEFTCHVSLPANNTGTVRQVRMFKNGSEVSRSFPLAPNANNAATMEMTRTFPLVAGDSMDCRVGSDASSVLAVVNTSGQTYANFKKVY